MNIQKVNGKVIMEMTVTEAKDIQDAFFFAQQYWQTRTAESQSDESKAIFRHIATEYHTLRNEIAEVIGY